MFSYIFQLDLSSLRVDWPDKAHWVIHTAVSLFASFCFLLSCWAAAPYTWHGVSTPRTREWCRWRTRWRRPPSVPPGVNLSLRKVRSTRRTLSGRVATRIFEWQESCDRAHLAQYCRACGRSPFLQERILRQAEVTEVTAPWADNRALPEERIQGALFYFFGVFSFPFCLKHVSLGNDRCGDNVEHGVMLSKLEDRAAVLKSNNIKPPKQWENHQKQWKKHQKQFEKKRLTPSQRIFWTKIYRRLSLILRQVGEARKLVVTWANSKTCF